MAGVKALHNCTCTCVDDRLGVYDTAVDFYTFLGRRLERDNDNGNWSSDDFEIDCPGGSFVAAYSGSGTIVGADASGTASGVLTGPYGGLISVTVNAHFTSPGNGTYSV